MAECMQVHELEVMKHEPLLLHGKAWEIELLAKQVTYKEHGLECSTVYSRDLDVD